MLLDIYFEPQGAGFLTYLNNYRVAGVKYCHRSRPYMFQLEVSEDYLHDLKGIIIQNNNEEYCLKVSFFKKSQTNESLYLYAAQDVSYENLEKRPINLADSYLMSLGLCKAYNCEQIPKFVFLDLEYYKEDEVLKQEVKLDQYSFLPLVKKANKEEVSSSHLLSDILLNHLKINASTVDVNSLEINLIQSIEKKNKIFEYLLKNLDVIYDLLKDKDNVDYSKIKDKFFELFFINEEKILKSCPTSKGWLLEQCFNIIGNAITQYIVFGDKLFLVSSKNSEDDIEKILKLERKIAKQIIKPNKSTMPILVNLDELKKVLQKLNDLENK